MTSGARRGSRRRFGSSAPVRSVDSDSAGAALPADSPSALSSTASFCGRRSLRGRRPSRGSRASRLSFGSRGSLASRGSRDSRGSRGSRPRPSREPRRSSRPRRPPSEPSRVRRSDSAGAETASTAVVVATSVASGAVTVGVLTGLDRNSEKIRPNRPCGSLATGVGTGAGSAGGAIETGACTGWGRATGAG